VQKKPDLTVKHSWVFSRDYMTCMYYFIASIAFWHLYIVT